MWLVGTHAATLCHSYKKIQDERKCATWEIRDENDLCLVVQTALDLLEFGPPG